MRQPRPQAVGQRHLQRDEVPPAATLGDRPQDPQEARGQPPPPPPREPPVRAQGQHQPPEQRRLRQRPLAAPQQRQRRAALRAPALAQAVQPRHGDDCGDLLGALAGDGARHRAAQAVADEGDGGGGGEGADEGEQAGDEEGGDEAQGGRGGGEQRSERERRRGGRGEEGVARSREVHGEAVEAGEGQVVEKRAILGVVVAADDVPGVSVLRDAVDEEQWGSGGRGWVCVIDMMKI